MWLIVDIAMDNGERYQVARPIKSNDRPDVEIVPELIELLDRGRVFLLEKGDASGGVRHVILSARHISRISWQVAHELPNADTEPLWTVTGAPAD